MKAVIKVLTPLISIGAILTLELVAISHGIDGVLFSGVIALLAGLGGFHVKNITDLSKVIKNGKRS